MSSTLALDPTPTTTTPPRTPSLPVGARFPRTWPPEAQLAVETPTVTTALNPALLFPVGRRFWRPTPEAIKAAAATQAAVRRQPPPILPPPTGARFPRHSAAQ